MASGPFDNLAGSTPQPDEQSDGLDVLGFLRRRKSFVILLSMVGAGIGYMMFQRQTPEFRSDAQVRVIHRNADPSLSSMLPEKDLTDSEHVIKSPQVIATAIREHNLGSLDTLAGLSEEDAINQITGMLSTQSLSANVVLISCRGANPNDTRSIANAVAHEYRDTQEANYESASIQINDILTKAKDGLHEDLNRETLEYQKFREGSHLTTDGKNPYTERAQSAYSRVNSIELQKTELQAELEQLEGALNRNGSREAILLLVSKTNAHTTVANSSNQAITAPDTTSREMSNMLLPLLLEQTRLRESVGEDHPDLKAISQRILVIQDHFRMLAGEKLADEKARQDAVVPESTDPAGDFLNIYLQSLREQLLVLEKQHADFLTLAKTEEAKARNLMLEELEDRDRQGKIERLQMMFDETMMKMKTVEFNADMGGVTAQVLAPAKHGVLIFPLLSQFLGLGAFLGGFTGLVLGYLVEVADRSFRKPEEIIREFGVPIMGHVPFMNEQKLKSVDSSGVFDRTAVSLHLPRSRPAEAYRSVRTAVCFSAFGGAHRVLQVTSPAAGDGKSTLALNLALSMAQSGKRTILVESDFRRPKVHRLTGVSNHIGFVDVLRGKAELPDAIQATSVPDFFVLPCGSRPKDPAELLTRPAYEQLLQVLREQYEYVIIDTPPVLAVTDPCGVAARVDGVLVCMRLSRHTRELGRRTIDQLREVGATIAGIVVNGVEERDAYGYGNYRYSDYRYYYKNYNYRYGAYGSNDPREYFTDDSTPEVALLPAESAPQVQERPK